MQLTDGLLIETAEWHRSFAAKDYENLETFESSH